MGQTREQRIIKQVTGNPQVQKQTPIATDMFIPNHSGDHGHFNGKRLYIEKDQGTISSTPLLKLTNKNGSGGSTHAVLEIHNSNDSLRAIKTFNGAGTNMFTVTNLGNMSTYGDYEIYNGGKIHTNAGDLSLYPNFANEGAGHVIIENGGDTETLEVKGGDLEMNSNNITNIGSLYFNSTIDHEMYDSSGDFYIKNSNQDKDIIFSYNDGGVSTSMGIDSSRSRFYIPANGIVEIGDAELTNGANQYQLYFANHFGVGQRFAVGTTPYNDDCIRIFGADSSSNFNLIYGKAGTYTDYYLIFKTTSTVERFSVDDEARISMYNGSFDIWYDDGGAVANIDTTAGVICFNENDISCVGTITADLFDGVFTPDTLADASASNNTVYYSSTQNKLVYKDSSGTVNNLY